MNIAFISDIHSNFHALVATLEDISKRGVDKIYCLGDILGYNTFPGEVIELLKEKGIISIKGNHDENIVNGKFSHTESKDLIKKWTLERLSEEHISYIKSLPFTIKLDINGKVVNLFHGSPASIKEYLFEDSKNAEEVMATYEDDILICAHTHFPYFKYYGDKLIINSGSVGKPKIESKKSSYVIVNFLDNKTSVDIIEVEYDIEKTALHNEKYGFDKTARDLRP